jgi:mannosyl-3-phosphoglycerate phosphatase
MLEAADFAVQIRSPIHSYPVLSRQHKVLQTSLYGPEGWTVAIEQLLTKQLIPIPTHQEVSHG